MEIRTPGNEKLPPKKYSETVTLPMPERDTRKVASSLYEIGNRLQAYAEPDTVGVHICKTALHETLPDGFDSIVPTRIEVEMRHTTTKNGLYSAELDINGANVTLHPDPLGEVPGIWSVKQKGHEDKLYSHDELLFDKLSHYLPQTAQLEKLLDRPVIEDSDMLRVLADSLVHAGAKRETHARYTTKDFILQGDLSNQDSFYDTTIGSEIVISDLGHAIRYGCITKQSFEIGDFSAVQLASLTDTEIDPAMRGDPTIENDRIAYGSVDAFYRFGVAISKKDGEFISQAQLTTESATVPAKNLSKIAKQAKIVGVPVDVFMHTLENVAVQHLPDDTAQPTEELL